MVPGWILTSCTKYDVLKPNLVICFDFDLNLFLGDFDFNHLTVILIWFENQFLIYDLRFWNQSFTPVQSSPIPNSQHCYQWLIIPVTEFDLALSFAKLDQIVLVRSCRFQVALGSVGIGLASSQAHSCVGYSLAARCDHGDIQARYVWIEPTRILIVAVLGGF